MDSTAPATSQREGAPNDQIRPETAIPFLASISGTAVITGYLAFRSGGYFAGAPAIVAVVLGVALMLRLVLADAPFQGFGTATVLATVGLGAYAAWALLSATWSHAPAQALIQFDLALMYWLGLVFFGSFAWSPARVVWAVRLLAAAMFLVTVAALITRLTPGIHSIPVSFENSRLSFPLSYWNALGAFIAVAILLCAGLSTRKGEAPVVQALAAGSLPILAAGLYFTFSRGAIAAFAVCLVIFLLTAAGRELITSLLSIVPPTAVAIVLCAGTGVLSTGHFFTPTGVGEGNDLAWELLGCAVAGALLRLALVPVDRRLAAIEVPERTTRNAWIVAVAAALVVVVVGGIAVDAPHRISKGFTDFTEAQQPKDPGALQGRLTSLNSDGRLAQWKLAVKTFGSHPLDGTGAGTFGRVWAKEGSNDFKVVNSHSLYLGVMSNLGLPGIVFLLVALIAIFVGLALRIRGPDRILYATIFAAALVWALHAGVDWDWELPATGFFVFGLGGVAIAADRADRGRVPPRIARVGLGIGALVLVISPALMAISQGDLNRGVSKLDEGDCPGASRAALSSIHTISVRPEPYQVLGFCDSRAGEHELAISLLRTAVSRDPGEWESFYGLALVQAAAGKDPRKSARRAYELAPNEPLTAEAVRMFRTNDPRKWERRALGARLPLL